MIHAEPTRFSRSFKALLFALMVVPSLPHVAFAQPALLPKAPIYVEDSPTANDLFAQAQELVQNQRWSQAVTRFQTVIDEYPHKLISRRDNEFIDAYLAVRDTLRANATLLETYRRLQEPTARAAFEKAKIGNTSWDADEAALALIMQQYSLCPAALDAGMLLAKRRIEQADGREALAILRQLENHPDLATQENHWHLLQVIAATMTNQTAIAQAHQSAIETSGDAKAIEQLGKWRTQLKIPALESVLSFSRVMPAIALPEPVWPPLWEVSLKNPRDAAMNITQNPEIQMGGMRPEGESGPNFALTLPVARGETVFVCDRESIWALDRSSGRVLWKYRNAPLNDNSDPMNGFIRSLPPLPEPRSVALVGDTVVAVLGSRQENRLRMSSAESTGQLVGLDAITGEVKWKLKSSDIDPSLSTASFQALPMGDNGNEGRIYVLLRRAQLSGFQDSFAVAVDLRTGKPCWRRHLSSALSANPPVLRSSARVLEQNSILYIADPSGTISCLDGRTGSVMWLTILPEARQAAEEQMRGMNRPDLNDASLDQPLCAPVLVDAGLIVPSLNTGWPALVIDPATGRRLRDLRGSFWTPTQGVRLWMVPAPGGLLLADATLTLVDGKTLTAKWSVPLSTLEKNLPAFPIKREENRAEVSPPIIDESLSRNNSVPGNAMNPGEKNNLTTSGWPAVTTNQILVPCRDKIVVLDGNTGSLVKILNTGASGNLLALDDQIIVASDTSVAGCLNWSRASTRLLQEISERQLDCNPGLALAHVAMVAKQLPSMITGVDAALDAMNRQFALSDASASAKLASEQLTAQLVEMCQEKSLDNSWREQLFNRLAQAARTPSQQVLYHMHYGRFLQENEQYAHAVDEYQEILQQGDLWSSIYRSSTGAKQAGLEAMVRIKELVRDQGVQIYAKKEAIAMQRLDELSRSGAGQEPENLLELARSYPLASCAPRAIVIASELYAKQGRRDQALRQMRLAYRMTNDASLLSRITGRVTEMYLDSANPKLARQWLLRCKRDHADLAPLHNGKLVSMDQWLAELTKMTPPQTQLPSFHLPVQNPIVLKGTPIFPQNQASGSWPRDLLLMQDGNILQLRSGRDLAVQWQLNSQDVDLKAVQFNDEQMLLWSEKSSTLSALETNRGKPIWPALAVQPLLDELGPPELRLSNRPLEQQKILQLFNNAPIQIRGGRAVFDKPQIQAGCMLSVNESVICIADHAGRIIGVDRATGQVRWREFVNMDRVDRIVMDEESLIVSGANWLKTEAQSDGLLVLDPLTGQSRFPMVEEEDPLQWVGLGGDGLLLYVTSKQATARHTNKGEIVWRVSLPQNSTSATAVVGTEALLVVSDGVIMALDLATGNMLRQTTGVSNSDSETPLITALDKQWYLTWSKKSIAVDQVGKLLWRDALTQDNRQLLVQLVGEEYVTILCMTGSMDTRVDAAIRRQILLDPRRAGLIGQRGIAQLEQRRMAQDFAAADRDARPKQGPFMYQLYFIERSSGRIMLDRALGPLPESIEDQGAAIQDDRLILGTRGNTVVIPGTISKP